MRTARSGMAPPRADAGFSLIEFVVALALLSAMLALLPGALQLARRVAATEPRIDRETRVQGARDALALHLSRALALPTSAGRTPPPFAGEPTSLSFIAPPPRSAAASGLQRYRLSLWVPHTPGRRAHLVLATQSIGPALSSTGSAPPVLSNILLEDVTQLSLRYLGRDGEGPPGWRTDWRDPIRLPLLVEITLTLRDGSASRREVLVVAPRLGVTG
jgi:general secretion pathway protein J